MCLTVLRSASLWETSVIMGQMDVCTLAILFRSAFENYLLLFLYPYLCFLM